MMTPTQVLAVAALGGLAAIAGLVLFVALAVGLYTAIDRLIERAEDRRAERAHHRRQHDLTICQAIDALPTTDHPTDD